MGCQHKNSMSIYFIFIKEALQKKSCYRLEGEMDFALSHGIDNQPAGGNLHPAVGETSPFEAEHDQRGEQSMHSGENQRKMGVRHSGQGIQCGF